MYGRIFESTFTGSMVGAGCDVHALWAYVIAHVRDSTVEVNPVLVGAVLGCAPERVEAALAYLCAPDARSRNPDHDGRRLLHEGGFQYHVVSHARYRALRNDDERREYNREKQREWRARQRNGKPSTGVNPPVIDKHRLSAQSEAYADPSPTPTPPPPRAPRATPPAKATRTSPAWAALDAERCRLHAEHHGGEPPPLRGTEASALGRMIGSRPRDREASAWPEELLRALGRYYADKDAIVEKSCHSLALMQTRLARYLDCKAAAPSGERCVTCREIARACVRGDRGLECLDCRDRRLTQAAQ